MGSGMEEAESHCGLFHLHSRLLPVLDGAAITRRRCQGLPTLLRVHLLHHRISIDRSFEVVRSGPQGVMLFGRRSSDRTKQLPMTVPENKEPAEQEVNFTKSFTDKIASKSQTVPTPSFTE